MWRRLVLLKSIISSSRYEIIRCFNSSIIFILHSLFDLIRCENAIILEKIHQKSHLLINITSHKWCKTVDFAFLYLKSRFLDFKRSFFYFRSRKFWNCRILKSTTIKSLRFWCFFNSLTILFSFYFLFLMIISFAWMRFFSATIDFFVFAIIFFCIVFHFFWFFFLENESLHFRSKHVRIRFKILFVDVFFRLFSDFFNHVCFKKHFRCIAR